MITVICLGKKHESMYEQAIAHFEGRLKPYTKLALVLLPHSSLENLEARAEESARIIARISTDEYVVLLDELGQNLTSPELAQKIELAQNSSKNMTFIIGGAYGVDDSIKNRADSIVAFGKAVFPHQLMRVMLLEQVYRAYSILAGSKYHHL